MIDGAKAEATTLMNSLRLRWGTERFAVAGFSDYVDFAYKLYQPLTGDVEAVQTAINGLGLAHGGDAPEAYGRMMFESYSDPSVGWNDGAQRYLIIFGDSYPHDPDAGRDGELGTPDDIALDEVLSTLTAQEITLIYVADPGVVGDFSLLSQWDDWAKTVEGTTIRCTGP